MTPWACVNGVHTDHRSALVLMRPDLLVKAVELGIPIRALTPLGGLGVGLQAVAQLLEQLAHHELAGLMPAFP